ncbi:hypothetical protein JST99_00550 [Candidatus Dependentiae bacterium]|nr:hypothetical protein [Candidatus Dependentiae bacterium]MCC7415156.1 hypothetical protein [Campylobacterota bacterium]
MQKILFIIALFSTMTCQIYASERFAVFGNHDTINKLDPDGMLKLHKQVSKTNIEDFRKAGMVGLLICTKALVYELPKCNKNALQFALENATKFPKTLAVVQAAALLEGTNEQAGQSDQYLQKMRKRAQKTINKHISDLLYADEEAKN